MIVQTSFAGVAPIYTCERCKRALSNPVSMRAGMGPICRHKKGIQMNKEDKKFDMRAWGDRFEYIGDNGSDGFCYIKINDARNVVIITEAPDNHGVSITNASEIIATKVCAHYALIPDLIKWIEHYVGLSDTFLDADNGETFDFVSFTIVNNICRRPKWQYAGREKAMALFENRIADE